MARVLLSHADVGAVLHQVSVKCVLQSNKDDIILSINRIRETVILHSDHPQRIGV